MNKFKELIGLIVYKCAPIKKNRIVFTSFEGQYNDNPKAIALKFHELYADKYELIWLLKDLNNKECPDYFKKFKIGTLKSFWIRGSAKIQIDNIYGISALFITDENKNKKFKRNIYSFLINKRQQLIFTTFHGTPLKRIGRDQINNTVLGMICHNTTMFLGDKYSCEIMKGVTFDQIPIQNLGTPRDDVLFEENIGIKAKLGICEEDKIVLFAPTFRNDGLDVDGKNIMKSGINQINDFNIDNLLNLFGTKFGGKWHLILRFHYHVANMINWADLKTKYGDKVINGNKLSDMSDYLCAADALITDSSSCMFDAIYKKMPCFLYFPDLDNYGKNERGFYMKLDDLPFPLSKTFELLMSDINSFNVEVYENKISAFLEKIGSVNDGKSSQRVVEKIIQSLKA